MDTVAVAVLQPLPACRCARPPAQRLSHFDLCHARYPPRPWTLPSRLPAASVGGAILVVCCIVFGHRLVRRVVASPDIPSVLLLYPYRRVWPFAVYPSLLDPLPFSPTSSLALSHPTMGVPIILPHPHPPHAHMLPSGSSYPPAGSRARQPSGPSTPRPGGDPNSSSSPARGAEAIAAAPPPVAAQGRRPRDHIRVRGRNPSLAPHRDVRYESLAGQRMAVYRRDKRIYEAGVLMAVWGDGMAAAAVAEQREQEEEEAEAEVLSDESAETSSLEGGDGSEARGASSGPVRLAASMIDQVAAFMGGGQHGSRRTEPGTFLMRYDSGEEEQLVLTREVWRLLHPTTGVVILEHVPVGEDELDEEDYPQDDGEYEGN